MWHSVAAFDIAAHKGQSMCAVRVVHAAFRGAEFSCRVYAAATNLAVCMQHANASMTYLAIGASLIVILSLLAEVAPPSLLVLSVAGHTHIS
jgi:hypothetical protein